jgi:hypothetical protein
MLRLCRASRRSSPTRPPIAERARRLRELDGEQILRLDA